MLLPKVPGTLATSPSLPKSSATLLKTSSSSPGSIENTRERCAWCGRGEASEIECTERMNDSRWSDFIWLLAFICKEQIGIAELKKRFRDIFFGWESLFASAVEFGCFCLIDGGFVGMEAIAPEWLTHTAAGSVHWPLTWRWARMRQLSSGDSYRKCALISIMMRFLNLRLFRVVIAPWWMVEEAEQMSPTDWPKLFRISASVERSAMDEFDGGSFFLRL